jgi:DNA polymerase-4
MIRRIAHLDMDAFYASVELLRYPQLKGLPVVIGGSRRRVDDAMLSSNGAQPLSNIPINEFPLLKDYKGRGVITTATYAARKFGIGSAMGLMKAAKLCPEAIMLPVDFDEYRKYSRMFKSEIVKVAPILEDRGIDEVFFDLTEIAGEQDDGGRRFAETIQASILEATGLTCSIGIAPNKLIAKMASEFNKPNGISVVFESDLTTSIWPLPCRKINGIGPKADEKLTSFGIRTIGELANQELSWLLQHFGKNYGHWLFNAAHGKDDRPVQTSSEPVSMSRETTFDRDLHAVRDKAELGAIFTRLCEQVAADLQRKGYVGKTIGVKLRYDDFKIATRDHTAQTYTNDKTVIRRLGGQCLKRIPLDKRLRLIGVRVGSLEKIANLNLDQHSDMTEIAPNSAHPTLRSHEEGVNLSLFDDE